MRLAIATATALGFALLTGCDLPGGGGDAPAYTDAQTVVNALSGKSVVGSAADGTNVCEFHKADGTLVGKDKDTYTGKWRVAVSDHVCYAYGNSAEDCLRAQLNVDKIRFTDATTGALVSQGDLVEGDVCSR